MKSDKFLEIVVTFLYWSAVFVTIAFVFWAGRYCGYSNGLYNGAIEYRTCMDNKAKGWYVEGTEFNCIF